MDTDNSAIGLGAETDVGWRRLMGESKGTSVILKTIKIRF